MPHTLEAKITKKQKTFQIEIRKDSFESFCDSIGLYRRDFLDALDSSERDHKAGRIKKRKSLHELIK